MKEEFINEVELNNEVINYFHNEISVVSIMDDSVDKILLYVHGFLADKKWLYRYKDLFYKYHIGLIAFDLPHHGIDTNTKDFSIEECVNYLNEMINYIKNTYHKDIYLLGSSFGTFVILNRLLSKEDDIKYVYFNSPAIDLSESLNMKLGLDDYFIDHDVFKLHDKLSLTKVFYKEIKDDYELIRFHKYKNIMIFQGFIDRTTLYSNTEAFSLNNNLTLVKFDEGKHELFHFEDDMVRLIGEHINNM